MSQDLDFKYLFENRKEAYKELKDLIPKDIEFDENWKIVTIGVDNILEVFEIADELGAKCEPFFLEDIYAPNNNECTIAVVSELKEIVIEKNLVRSFGISEDFIYDISERVYNEKILTKLYAFKKGSPIQDIKDKNFLIFTDGCETGLNVMCVIKSLINNNAKKIFLFTPVISEDLYQSLGMIVDKIYTNHVIKDFIETSYYFKDFSSPELDLIKYEIDKREKR